MYSSEQKTCLLHSSVTELKAMLSEKLLWNMGLRYRGSICISTVDFVYSYRGLRVEKIFIDTHVKNVMCCTARELSWLCVALPLVSIQNVSSWEMQ